MEGICDVGSCQQAEADLGFLSTHCKAGYENQEEAQSKLAEGTGPAEAEPRADTCPRGSTTRERPREASAAAASCGVPLSRRS